MALLSHKPIAQLHILTHSTANRTLIENILKHAWDRSRASHNPCVQMVVDPQDRPPLPGRELEIQQTSSAPADVSIIKVTLFRDDHLVLQF